MKLTGTPAHGSGGSFPWEVFGAPTRNRPWDRLASGSGTSRRWCGTPPCRVKQPSLSSRQWRGRLDGRDSRLRRWAPARTNSDEIHLQNDLEGAKQHLFQGHNIKSITYLGHQGMECCHHYITGEPLWTNV